VEISTREKLKTGTRMRFGIRLGMRSGTKSILKLNFKLVNQQNQQLHYEIHVLEMKSINYSSKSTTILLY
jgi:hypothetical protein